MPTENTQNESAGPPRNWVWRMVQLPVGVMFRFWAPLTVEGLENIDRTRPGLLIANHQSFLDPLLLAVRMTRPVSYVARDSLFRIPIVGWILRRTYVTPISRTAARAATIRAAVERLEQGFLVGIFPEGTRSTGAVDDFRPGFTAILRRRDDVPVYPVGIAGADRVMPRGSILPRPRRLRMVIGEPIPPEELQARMTGESKSQLVPYVREHVVRTFEKAAGAEPGTTKNQDGRDR